MDGDTGGLAGGVEAGDDLVLAVLCAEQRENNSYTAEETYLVNGQDLTGVLRRDTTHCNTH